MATPVGAAQSSFPVFASSATQAAIGAPSIVRETMVNAFPLATVNELKPPGVSSSQSRFRPVAGQVAGTDSVDLPSPCGPRYSDHSSAKTPLAMPRLIVVTI